MLELAYIDAGSGSLIIQGAIASIAAGIIFFRTQIARVIGKLRGRTEQTDAAPPAASVDDAAHGG